MRLLHVEDSEVCHLSLLDALEGLDSADEITLEWTTTLAATVRRLANGPGLDAIILDLGLPDARGLDAVKRLCALPDAPPLVVLTKDNSAVTGERAIALGAQDYLSKLDISAPLLEKTCRYAIVRQRWQKSLLLDAMTDPLTSLANRALLFDHLENALARAKRIGQSISVLYLDFDKFKHINDSFGHHVGDDFLRTVGTRLRQSSRRSDFVGRLGGDEFAVITEHSGPASDADMATMLLARLRAPYLLPGGVTINTLCSIGLAGFDPAAEPALTASELMKRADIAMYRAKRLGGNRFCAYSTTESEADFRGDSFVTRMESAANSGQFFTVFQPIVTTDGNIVGFELLLRWITPEGEQIGPAVFLPWVERTPLIHQLGHQPFTEAEQLAAFATDARPLLACINVSFEQLDHPGFADHVLPAVCAAKARGVTIVVELPETVLVQDWRPHRSVLENIRASGGMIALDDFGRHRLSVRDLLAFPFDLVKLDARDWLVHADARNDDADVLRSMIHLAKAAGKTVFLKNVESDDIATQALTAGIEGLQGFFMGTPGALEALAAAASATP